MKAVEKTNLFHYLNRIWMSNPTAISIAKQYTYVFELTSLENRIVTRYEDTKITLLTIRHNETGKELESFYVDDAAKIANVSCPKRYDFKTIEEVVESAKSLDTLDEGFVAVHETQPNFICVKCKNPKYVAIAHLRDNGKVSAKRLLTLVLSGDSVEFLSYFSEYTKYIEFVQAEWQTVLNSIQEIWQETKDISVQKDFALTIQAKTKHGLVLGCLFNMKKGKTFEEVINFNCSVKADMNKLFKSLNLKSKFEKQFKIQSEDEEEEN